MHILEAEKFPDAGWQTGVANLVDIHQAVEWPAKKTEDRLESSWMHRFPDERSISSWCNGIYSALQPVISVPGKTGMRRRGNRVKRSERFCRWGETPRPVPFDLANLPRWTLSLSVTHTHTLSLQERLILIRDCPPSYTPSSASSSYFNINAATLIFLARQGRKESPIFRG